MGGGGVPPLSSLHAKDLLFCFRSRISPSLDASCSWRASPFSPSQDTASKRFGSAACLVSLASFQAGCCPLLTTRRLFLPFLIRRARAAAGGVVPRQPMCCVRLCDPKAVGAFVQVDGLLRQRLQIVGTRPHFPGAQCPRACHKAMLSGPRGPQVMAAAASPVQPHHLSLGEVLTRPRSLWQGLQIRTPVLLPPGVFLSGQATSGLFGRAVLSERGGRTVPPWNETWAFGTERAACVCVCEMPAVPVGLRCQDRNGIVQPSLD